MLLVCGEFFRETTMKTFAVWFLFASSSLSLLLVQQPVAKENKVELNGHTFTLPPGFEIELVAGPPLVDRPIAADFDDQGRLYVTESSGSNEKVQIQLEKKPHRVLRLEDTDGDGKFDKRTVFADKMMFPEGIMWRDGSVYVAAVPSIWKLTDTDGDGVADQRSEWFQGKTMTGCANDLHGPYAAPDGWIYWCKGAFAEQTYERPGKKPLVTKAAHIFRSKPDGSNIEPVMTGGMDNPVDVVFTPNGERIFTTTFLQYPAGGKRDGLLHAVHGGIYGKDYFVIYNHPWSGPNLMPVLSHLGPAAPCGLHRYENSAFGQEYQDNIFACLFNLQKVTRHVLTPDGATFKSKDSDFVVSSNKDFHPTDVIEDADGSLLIVDTGGWYKLCCPTSQLIKAEVLGGIYRVRKKGMPKLDDPRGLKINWANSSANELARLLGDPRPFVRKRAMDVLAKKGNEALPALEMVLASNISGNQYFEARRNAVWTATRIDGKAARALVRKTLNDGNETVRQVALHSISLWKDAEAVPALIKMLKNKSMHNRRAAAEALGRIGDKQAVPALLTAAGDPADHVLNHARIFALIEIGDREGTAKGLQSKSPLVRRAALIALDQMEKGELKAEPVVAELATTNAVLKEAAWWIASRHPEWGQQLTGFLKQRLEAKNLEMPQQVELVQILSQVAREKNIQQLLADMLSDAQAPKVSRLVVMKAMAKAGLKEAPTTWLNALTQALSGDEERWITQAVQTARALRLPKTGTDKLLAALLPLGNNDKLPPLVRLNALAAQPKGLAQVSPTLLAFLQEQVKTDQPVSQRTLAAEVLSQAKLSPEQLLDLTQTLKTAGPMEADRLLEAFAQSKNDKVGHALVDALKASKVKAALRTDKLKTTLGKYSADVQKQAEELFASLKTNSAEQKARLEQLLPLVKKGDIHRGHTVFNNPKYSCVACHTIGYVGGKIGPDLTRIGGIRTELDLLEAIVYPSASLVRSYEPVAVATTQGKVHNGIITKETATEITLVTGADQQATIPREEIEEILPSSVSIMPAGLDKQLSDQELADLVTFLKACK